MRFAAAALVALATVSCGSDGSERTGVTVFAAASLTAAFTELAEAFAADTPDVEVTLSFAGSSELVAQILEGAPADVFASADLANMNRLTEASGHADAPVVFATNAAEIVVEAGNPLGIDGVADLAEPDLVVVLCAPEVPCGAYAEQVVERAGVTVTPRSFEQNVNAVVAKVALGEADAGIVYRTDVIAAGDAVAGVTIPADANVVAEYPIVTTADSANPAAADAFVGFVLGPTGQQILGRSGFGAP